MVHIDALYHLTVYEKQKLRILRIIPLIDLRAYMHPHPLTVKFFRYTVDRLEPIVTVFPIPVHILAVKTLPWCQVFLRIFRMYIVALFVFPVIDRKLLLYF